MSFQHIDIKPEYRSLSDNIVRDFYIPLLEKSILYKRAVGFFSSTALIEISKGITGLIKNGGRMLLVASPRLSNKDIEAINKGFNIRNKIIKKTIKDSIIPPKDFYEEKRLNLLVNLISNGKLDIKIAFTENNHKIGLFHEKMGLLYDKQNNIVAFTGSMNETSTAFSYNYESIDVFCSWNSDTDRVMAKEKAFEDIWYNCEPKIKVIDFPEVAKKELEKYRTSYDIDLENEFEIFEKNQFEYDFEFNKRKRNIPIVPYNVKLYDYQTEAINNWEKANYRGIFDMATGTGKTFTGLGAIVRLSKKLLDELAVVIVCPYQHLVEQWVEDIVKFNISPIIGYSASSQNDWKVRLEDAIRDQKLKVRSKGFFCFICTNATFSSDFVQKQVNKIRGNALLVIDEAHNFGSENLRKLLSEKFLYRLALSATINRHNDKEGTAKLFSYFGDKCIEYSLERAIEENKLTRYKYYPIITTLSPEELQEYLEITYEISKCLIKTKNGKLKLSDKGKILALSRARLVAGAKYKISNLKEYIKPYVNDKHILVYCGATKVLQENQDFTSVDCEDLRQIDVVTNLLGNKLNMKVSQFTSKEDVKEREILKREFANGDTLQALIAIKCLDEGVNIPKIKVAFILASTTNPKEYIQRRGRVLRLAEGKEFAEIYDFVTIPRPLDEVSSITVEQMKRELTLVKNELNRAQEFSRIAMNMVEAESVLDEIREAYSINDNLFTFEGDFDYGL